MSAWREAHSPALKIEEAALLPALPRHGTGGAALKWALKGAADAAKKQRSATAAFQPQPAPEQEQAPPRVRAALRHVLRKKL